jgi:hypothetical protein
VLIALTITLAIAVLVLAAIAWRMVRLERQRSEARIAALATAIDEPSWTPPATNPSSDTALSEPSAVSLFAPAAPHAGRGSVFAFAVGALVVGLAAAVGLFAERAERGPGAGTVPHPQAAPLELLSMRHALDGDRLVVSGLVRNASESQTTALTARVSALSKDGRVIARGQSPIDPVVLSPGKETEFRVTVAHGHELERYRLSFVHNGQVLPHVDRRSDRARTAMATD